MQEARERSREPHCGWKSGGGATAGDGRHCGSGHRRSGPIAGRPNPRPYARKREGPGSTRHRGPYRHREPSSSRFVFWLPKRNPVRTGPYRT
jgi:hypothetical protein